MIVTKEMEVYIDRSYEQYTALRDVLTLLRDTLGTNSLDTFNQVFAVYLDQVEKCHSQDDELRQQMVAFSGLNLHPDMSKKLDELKELQGNIAAMTKDALSHAKIVKSLLAVELKGVTQGRTALKGYKSTTCRDGKIVKKTY